MLRMDASRCIPPPPRNNYTAPAFRLPNGVFVDACLVFKAGWTEWHELLLRATRAKPETQSFEPYAHAPLVHLTYYVTIESHCLHYRNAHGCPRLAASLNPRCRASRSARRQRVLAV